MIRHSAKALLGAMAGFMLLSGTAPAWGQLWGASEEALRKCAGGDIAECKLIGENLDRQLYSMRPARLPEVPEVERQLYWALGKACDLDDGEACYKLGDVRNPTGLFGAPRTPENYAGATAALKRACDTHKIADACRLLAGVLASRGNPQRDEVAAEAYRQRTAELERTQPAATATVPAAPTPAATAATRPIKPSIAEHIRKYGKVDGIAPASPGLLKLLLERRAANGGSSVLKEADIVAIRDHLLGDGRIDDQERDLLVELTWPDIRAVRIYRAGDADPWKGEGTTFSSISQTRCNPLIALLDMPPADLSWDDSDRKGTLMRLARASRTPGMEPQVRQLIAGQVAEFAKVSTEESKYQPLTKVILDMAMTAKTLEEDCSVATIDANGVRTTFVAALEEGVKQSAGDFPPARHMWLKPLPSGSRKTDCNDPAAAPAR